MSATSTVEAPGRPPSYVATTGAVLRHEFRTMGTRAELVAPAETSTRAFRRAAAAVERTFEQADRRFSRFRPDSELSRVNARAGLWTGVSAQFLDVLTLALAGARRTDGLFDPTVLAAVVAAGYDRDYGEIEREGAVVRDPPTPGGRWTEVEVTSDRLRLPPGGALDFGGVAKGWAVDAASRFTAGLPWAVVSAGGDLRVTAQPSHDRSGEAVEIGVEDPFEPGTHLARLSLSEGALATSSVLSRTWGPGLHQIIDPRTARPAVTAVVQATVWAATCAEAEMLATWAVLGGPSVLDRVPGMLVTSDGLVLSSIGRDDAAASGGLAS